MRNGKRLPKAALVRVRGKDFLGHQGEFRPFISTPPQLEAHSPQ